MSAATASVPRPTAVKAFTILHDATRHQACYELSPPYEGHKHVAVCATKIERREGPHYETAIFPCSPSGRIPAWDDLASVGGTISHTEALKEIGYRLDETVVPTSARFSADLGLGYQGFLESLVERARFEGHNIQMLSQRSGLVTRKYDIKGDPDVVMVISRALEDIQDRG